MTEAREQPATDKIVIQEVFVKNPPGWFRKVGDGPWESVSLAPYNGMLPVVWLKDQAHLYQREIWAEPSQAESPAPEAPQIERLRDFVAMVTEWTAKFPLKGTASEEDTAAALAIYCCCEGAEENIYELRQLRASVAATVESPSGWRSLLKEIDKWCSGENQVDDGEDAEDALRYIQDAIKAFLVRAGAAATGESPTDIFERARVALECQKKHLGDDPIDDAWIADFAAAFASTQIKMAGDPLQPATEERKEFEASVEFVGYEFNKISTGDYANRDTYHAFLGWAARSRRKTE